VRLRRVANGIDKTWIDPLWGTSRDGFHTRRRAHERRGQFTDRNFAPPSGRSEAYAIVGVLHTDAQGFPFYDSSDAATVLHEMNHPYVTPLIRANAESSPPPAESLYASVAKDDARAVV
jgi:hypothetical protein